MSKPNFRKLRADIEAIYARLGDAGVLDPDDIAWLKAQRATTELAPTPEEKDVAALLAKLRYNPQAPPVQPAALYSLAGNVIATAENLMVVQAKMKAGKSAAIGAMLASTMDPTGDCLGFASSNPNRWAVVHFDTEQSSYDHYSTITRAIRRAGKASPPPWFSSYHLKGHSVARIRELVLAGVQRAADDCGGVHSVFLDGIADLCADVNDAAEANALVAEMEALAMKFKTLTVNVLHENHGSDNGKTRGHLGSQLARKAETNLRLEKDTNGVTIMFADTSRSVHITKKQAPGFRWCDEAKAHVSVASTFGAVAAERAMREMRTIAGMMAPEGITHTNLIGAIMAGKEDAEGKIAGCSESTAKRFLAKMLDAFIITKKEDRYFSNVRVQGS